MCALRLTDTRALEQEFAKAEAVGMPSPRSWSSRCRARRRPACRRRRMAGGAATTRRRGRSIADADLNTCRPPAGRTESRRWSITGTSSWSRTPGSASWLARTPLSWFVDAGGRHDPGKAHPSSWWSTPTTSASPIGLRGGNRGDHRHPRGGPAGPGRPGEGRVPADGAGRSRPGFQAAPPKCAASPFLRVSIPSDAAATNVRALIRARRAGGRDLTQARTIPHRAAARNSYGHA